MKAWFFRIGAFSLLNDTLWSHLPRVMPEFDWQSVDVEHDIVRARPSLYLRATAEALVQYGSRIAATRQPPRDFFPRLPSVIQGIHDWTAKHVDKADSAFTFQMQSLFDASAPGLPHFLYTDHTYLANLRYPNSMSMLPVPDAWRRMEAQLYREAATTFVFSEFARTSVIEDYEAPPDRVVCMNSGSNLPLPKRADFPERSGNVILFAAVDWERKGGPELLRAFAKVRESLPHAELWIVGCQPVNPGDGVRCFDRVSREELGEFFAKADVFCLPSRMDPSASVLIEAAGWSLPVVATPVGGNLERVIDGETGYLREADALAEALVALLSDGNLRILMGTAGRRLVEERFTWKKIADRMAEHIRSCITQ